MNPAYRTGVKSPANDEAKITQSEEKKGCYEASDAKANALANVSVKFA